MATLDVVRVFTAADGSAGNPLGVFLRGAEVPEDARQRVAADLGFSETVFVDDWGEARLRIFTPATELPLAGHPLVGTAWLLAREGMPASVLRPPAGEVPVRTEAEMTFVRARAAWCPPFEFVEYGSREEVGALTGPPEGIGLAYCWAWEDRDAGRVRARSFVTEVGVAEDEATGSAALPLAVRLGRAIEVRQGVGSDLFARPLEDDWGEVGGRVAHVERRQYVVPR
ncbi:MAG TPA: PhzF family phenazine biosynthesis protein [Solirubrobacterales bacterium]|jgi:predicted PhzF superfamily epimerase YddE/YHI9